MTTDSSEKGLETLIMRHMTGTDGLTIAPYMVAERPLPYGGTGYIAVDDVDPDMDADMDADSGDEDAAA